MQDQTTRLNFLYQRWFDRQATEAEIEEFFDLLSAAHPDISWYQMLEPAWEKLQESPIPERIGKLFDLARQDRIAEQILGTYPTQTENAGNTITAVHRIHFLRRGWFRYAAAIIIIFGIGAYLFTSNKKENQQPLANGNKQLQTDVLPGGEKAVLTLADGSKIVLDNAANGNLAQQGNAQVIKLSDGQIAYNLKGWAGGDVMMNTMATPKGGQYQLTLPDGSKVWLNAASSIQFPAAFAGSERKVKITGEVYFEIAKNKVKPFIVDVDGKSTVQVLGTSFNINSYEDEQNIKATLIEGSVKVSNNNNKQAIIKPGQQAQINSTVEIVDADIEQTLAWKDGLFSFNDADLRSVMRQLERWYDIKVKYEGSVSDIGLKGEMYRNVNLSTVLNFLRRMGINTRTEGKTVIVM